MTHSPARLVWVRHGQSTWNVIDRFQGRIHHPPLTAKGREQAQAAARSLEDMRAGRIVSSPLRRAAQTAHLIGEHLHLPVEYDELLMEQEFDESAEAVVGRGQAFLDRRWDGTAIVVTHGNFIAHLASHLHGEPVGAPDNGVWLELPLPSPAGVP